MGYKIPVVTFYDDKGNTYPFSAMMFTTGHILDTWIPGKLQTDAEADATEKEVTVLGSGELYMPQAEEVLIVQFTKGNTATQCTLKFGAKTYTMRKSPRPNFAITPEALDATQIGNIAINQLCLIQIKNEFAYWLDWDFTEVIQEALNKKADQQAMDTALTAKADKETVNKALETKADKTAIPTKYSDLTADIKYTKLTVYPDISVAPSNFSSDTTYPDFPWRALVTLSDDVKASMYPIATFSVKDAISGVVAPVAECVDKGIYIYATEQPEANIDIASVAIYTP